MGRIRPRKVQCYSLDLERTAVGLSRQLDRECVVCRSASGDVKSQPASSPGYLPGQIGQGRG